MYSKIIFAIKLFAVFSILELAFCGSVIAFPYQPGWPQATDGDVFSSPAIGDIDNDGDLEVVVGSKDDYVYAWHHDGRLVDGWPQATSGSVVASPALVDIDGDGYLEIVVGSLDDKVYVWRYNGEIVIGWPQKAGGDVRSSPAIGDIDNDGDLEIVIGTNSFSDNAWAWHHNGGLVAGWPKDIGYYVNSTPTLADLDGDGDLEIVLLSMGSGDVCILHHDGSPVSGWPTHIGSWTEYNDAAIGDIDKDEDLEVVVAAGQKVYTWHHNGVLLTNWPVTLIYSGVSSPTLADLDGDGDLEIVVSVFRYSTPGKYSVYILHHDGSIASGWPIAKSTYGNPVVGDIDADGDMEVIFGSDDDGKVYAFHYDGTSVTGFPLSTGDIINSTVAITDLDGDGDIELVVGSYDDKVHVWDLPGQYNPEKIEWNTYHHDVWHTGLYGFVSTSPLSISPDKVFLKTGDIQQFKATGGVEPYKWTATGGSLDTDTGPTVTYTAGDVEGEYYVTVTDAQSQEATAIVNIVPDVPSAVFAIFGKDLYKSTDKGMNWQLVLPGGEFPCTEPPEELCYEWVSSFTIDPIRSNIVWAAYNSYDGVEPFTQILKSTDGGEPGTWVSKYEDHFGQFGPGIDPVDATDIEISKSDPDVIYIGIEYRYGGIGSADHLPRSPDGGETWEARYLSQWERISAVAVDPTDENIVYIGVNDSWDGDTYVRRSLDGGVNWNTVLNLGEIAASSIEVDPNYPSLVYVGTVVGELYRSPDGGENWKKLQMTLDNGVNSIVIDPTDSNVMYIATYDGIYKTSDGGATWNQTLLGKKIRSVIIDSEDSSIIYASAEDGIYRSSDRAETWDKVFPPSVIYGDVSGNDTVSAYDAVMVLQYVVGLITLTDAQKEAADVSKNGAVTAYDSALILQYVVGLIPSFSTESEADAPILNVTSESELLAKAIKELEGIHLDDEQKRVVEQLKRLLTQQSIPAYTTLLQNYPNPFNPETWIPFQLARDANVILHIYNIHGQLVRVLSLGRVSAGFYLHKEKAAYWDGRDSSRQFVASGVYFYTLQVDRFTATRKMVIVK